MIEGTACPGGILMNAFTAVRLLILVCIALIPGHALAMNATQAELAEFNKTGDFDRVRTLVQESRPFYGMASYYNSIAFYLVDIDGVVAQSPGEDVQLVQGQWFAAMGRFDTLLVSGPGLSLTVSENTFITTAFPRGGVQAELVRNDRLSSQYGLPLEELRYAHLWRPVGWLAGVVESSLVALQQAGSMSWGLAIICFTVALKVLLVPLGVVTVRMQRKVSEVQLELAPQLASIKAQYDGEEAHNRIMAAHKSLGVSPFFVLKPMLGMLLQIPIWIAVFNALGEMPQLQNSGFLWIESLAYPDSIARLPFVIPLLGDSVSLLPWLMSGVTLLSALLFQDRLAPADELRKQKRNLYFIALAFFLLFYPFPAAMVLYWTLSNALQIVQQHFIRV
ncbi:membrane protein insertase YidC [Halieaceae bacterium IMCC11814]|uniref:Membrane protein insertase YidC n=2 Tax=Candidatus Marimicrobium litorale TaxID=2518991 RepID=A0ABT3T356_9GAMM|nr:membrane protein insertase YidC [Candidatus Marimicrobium litorale]